jgi:hypothetical protein
MITKENTAPGPNKIPYQVFKFLNLHNSKIFELLSIIFQHIYNNYILDYWKIGKTTLIPKKNAAEFYNNWRPIILLNTIYKIFSTIINQTIIKIFNKIKYFQKRMLL